MERAPFRIKDADVEAILAEPRFRAFAILYLSDPRPVGRLMRRGFVIRRKIHFLFNSLLPTIYVHPETTNLADRPKPVDPGEPEAPPSEEMNGE